MEQSQKQNARQHGPALTRRGLLVSGIAGTAGLLLPGARAVSSTSAVCALDRELTQGPYYLDRSILRRNVTEGKPGLPLQPRLAVIDARTCTPLQNAAVEIWHCDAAGIYSRIMPPGMAALQTDRILPKRCEMLETEQEASATVNLQPSKNP